jgi:hypothetical protein
MARPQTHGKTIGSFSGFFYEEEKQIADALEERRRRKGCSRSEIIKDAIREYVKPK